MDTCSGADIQQEIGGEIWTMLKTQSSLSISQMDKIPTIFGQAYHE